MRRERKKSNTAKGGGREFQIMVQSRGKQQTGGIAGVKGQNRQPNFPGIGTGRSTMFRKRPECRVGPGKKKGDHEAENESELETPRTEW